jgi:hypothetical protein
MFEILDFDKKRSTGIVTLEKAKGDKKATILANKKVEPKIGIRPGQSGQIGQFFIAQVAHIFGLLFPQCINFTKNVLDYVLGDIFHSLVWSPSSQRYNRSV